MTTQIIHGNPNQILEMRRAPSMISTTLTLPPHAPSPLTQQTFFCSSKSSRSCLLNSTHAAFLLITWKSIFRRGVVLQFHFRDYSFNRLNQLFSPASYLIYPFQTSNHEEILYKNSLISHPSYFHKHMFASWQTLCHQT